jgi:hypothetical protein
LVQPIFAPESSKQGAHFVRIARLDFAQVTLPYKKIYAAPDGAFDSLRVFLHIFRP